MPVLCFCKGCGIRMFKSMSDNRKNRKTTIAGIESTLWCPDCMAHNQGSQNAYDGRKICGKCGQKVVLVNGSIEEHLDLKNDRICSMSGKFLPRTAEFTELCLSYSRLPNLWEDEKITEEEFIEILDELVEKVGIFVFQVKDQNKDQCIFLEKTHNSCMDILFNMRFKKASDYFSNFPEY